MKGANEFDLDITQVFIVTMLRLLVKTAQRKNLEAEKMVIFWFSVFNRHSVWGWETYWICSQLDFFFFVVVALIDLPLCPHHRLTASAGTVCDGLSVCLCLFTN